MTPTTCDPDRLVCAVRDLIDAVSGNPWPEFALTALATLLGAVVGALASWLFSIDLARRAKAERAAELLQAKADRDAERAQAAADHRTDRIIDQEMRQLDRQREYEERAAERLDIAVATVIERIGAWDAAGRAFQFALHARGAGVSVEPPHGARAQLLSSIRVAQMSASEQEMPPLNATYDIVTARRDDSTSESRALDYQNAADTLAEWRRGLLSASEAAHRILHRPRTTAPGEDHD